MGIGRPFIGIDFHIEEVFNFPCSGNPFQAGTGVGSGSTSGDCVVGVASRIEPEVAATEGVLS